MNTKTIRLSSENFRLRNGVVECFIYSPKGDEEKPWEDYKWVPSKYKIGARGILVSSTDVSPNAVRNGTDSPRYWLTFRTDGIPGNSNPNILRYHGWRGTTNDSSLYAHGLREIMKIRELKSGDIAITVGPDLSPEKP